MSDDPGLFEVMFNTRAMRKLKPDEVPEDVLIKLVEAANQAPTGSNMQAMRWIVIRDREQKRKLAALNATAVNAYLAADGGGRAESLPHQSQAKRDRMKAAGQWQADHLADVPAIFIACHVFEQPVGARGAGFGAGSVYPGVQNLLLAARAFGLGAALTTLGLSNRDAARELLGLPDNVEAYAIIPVGYRGGNFGPVTRLPVGETMHWDRWST